MDDDRLRVEAQASNAALLRGVKNEVSVAFDLVTTDTGRERRPVRLVILLDISYSMMGAKLAHCKHAIEKVVDELDDRDSVSLMTFNNNAQLWFTDTCEDGQLRGEERKRRLLGCLRAIESSGGTNLWDGLECAVARLAVTSAKQKGGVGATSTANGGEMGGPPVENRILLFSDGDTNEGRYISNEDILAHLRPSLRAFGIKVFTAGVGDDFNEALMREIAEMTLANYFFIEDTASILRFIQTALCFILAPVVFDVTLQIQGLNGSMVTKAYGYSDLSRGILLGDLPPGRKGIVAEVSVAEPSERDVRSVKFLKYTVLFQYAGDTLCRRVTGKVAVRYTSSVKRVARSVNSSVVAKALVARSAVADKQIINAMETGDKAQALSLMEKQIGKLVEAEKYDQDGGAMAALLLCDAQRTTERLRKEGLSSAVKKKVHHHDHMMAANFDGFTYVATNL
eukprot:CAMPEP_0119127578 /NCGR_PEP_ID=MMETSP1310-20130426/6074_1 /TAXON_ID=464262 /ORGANISM="Genus nov. species nov., Strain RCC2339" /LENGTH=453 /DNA_ID=CAMNT_0007117849 /DNA_START=328 /DNA_END=1689 /DNA_ORIENTATION=-